MSLADSKPKKEEKERRSIERMFLAEKKKRRVLVG